MQILLEQARKQLNSMQECENNLLHISEDLSAVRNSSVLKQEQFIYLNAELKRQMDDINQQQQQLKKMISVLGAAIDCYEKTESDASLICSGSQYIFIRPYIRRMNIQHVIPLPHIVLD